MGGDGVATVPGFLCIYFSFSARIYYALTTFDVLEFFFLIL
jgi:hypothetical protein